MKTLKLSILTIAVLISLNCTAQEYYALGGTSFSNSSNTPKWHERFGYAFGVGYSNFISDKVGYLAEAQFVNQRSEPNNIHSICGMFAFRIPVSKRIYLDPGFKIGREMFGVIGLKYEWLKSKRVDFIARYNHPLGNYDSIFKGYGIVGATYKFN